MAKFMKHYEILLNKAKVDLKAAQNLYHDITSGDEELDYEVVLFPQVERALHCFR